MASDRYSFASDTHRRVAGNLAQPRSVADLCRILRALDPYVDEDAHDPDGLDSYLADLEADGLVKRVGPFDDVEAGVAAIQGDGDVITLPKEKAANLLAVAAAEDRYPHLHAEEQWLLRPAGLDALTAEAPGSGLPLKGPALRAAEAANARLAEEERELFRRLRSEEAERLRKRAEELEREAEDA